VHVGIFVCVSVCMWPNYARYCGLSRMEAYTHGISCAFAHNAIHSIVGLFIALSTLSGTRSWWLRVSSFHHHACQACLYTLQVACTHRNVHHICQTCQYTLTCVHAVGRAALHRGGHVSLQHPRHTLRHAVRAPRLVRHVRRRAVHHDQCRRTRRHAGSYEEFTLSIDVHVCGKLCECMCVLVHRAWCCVIVPARSLDCS
jgi:hypothetical protein